jgi:hypothetical protein
VVERAPFRPVLRGRLLTSSGPRYMRYDAAGGGGEGEATTHTLWWPPGKVNGRYLAPWLAALDEETSPTTSRSPAACPSRQTCTATSSPPRDSRRPAHGVEHRWPDARVPRRPWR